MHPNHIPDLSSCVSSDKAREAKEVIADVFDKGWGTWSCLARGKEEDNRKN